MGEETLAKFLCRLMNRFYLPAKVIKRRNQHVVYLKASDKIADFLRMCKANDALFEFEDSRIQRDFLNSLTRLDNCELANEMKSLSAARRQLEDIAGFAFAQAAACDRGASGTSGSEHERAV